MDRITIGWRWLEKTLNEIIDHVNRQKPLASATIAVEESPTGSLLKAVGAQSGPSQAGGAGGGAGYVDDDSAYVKWGSYPGVIHGVSWKAVTIVDPSTCAQSTIQVLIKDPNGSVNWPITIEPP
jgi:hypothetical protein